MFRLFERILFWVASRASVSATSLWQSGRPVRRSELRSEDCITTNRRAFAARSFLLRLVAAGAMVLSVALLSRAGGPKNVAGTSYFQAGAAGQPLVWAQGTITYYTDQGDLSPLLPNAAANDFVAAVFSVWTSVPTAAIT